MFRCFVSIRIFRLVASFQHFLYFNTTLTHIHILNLTCVENLFKYVKVMMKSIFGKTNSDVIKKKNTNSKEIATLVGYQARDFLVYTSDIIESKFPG